MQNIQRMIASAQNAMIHVMNLKKDDQVLVVTDGYTKTIGEAFYQAAENYGCNTEIFVLPDADRPLSDVPAEMTLKLDNKTVVINLPGSVRACEEYLSEIMLMWNHIRLMIHGIDHH